MRRLNTQNQRMQVQIIQKITKKKKKRKDYKCMNATIKHTKLSDGINTKNKRINK